MRYFLDTEFIEGFKKPLFGKRRHFIDLISIGIYCEDGREYYAVSNEFNPKDTDGWVKENVLKKIELDFYRKESVYAKTYHSSVLTLKNFIKWKGKSNKQIANDIFQFVCPYNKASEYADCASIDEGARGYLEANPPEFYGYYADYDWVLLCSLFGRMIDLPKGFPYYCKDLKQMMDENGLTKEWKQENCPDPKDEHNALADAKWNYNLYKQIDLCCTV
jgi:hypothetical protein